MLNATVAGAENKVLSKNKLFAFDPIEDEDELVIADLMLDKVLTGITVPGADPDYCYYRLRSSQIIFRKKIENIYIFHKWLKFENSRKFIID